MGNCLSFGDYTTDLTNLAAFDYEVDPDDIIVVSLSSGPGQGTYQVSLPGEPTPIRYDRIGSVFMRHASAPPLPHERPSQVLSAGTVSRHAVIKFAAMDNQVPADSVKMIKMVEGAGSGTYHLNVNGVRVVYKKMGSVFMRAGSTIPGTSMVV